MSNAKLVGRKPFPVVWAGGLAALAVLVAGAGLPARAADAALHPRRVANKADDTRKNDSSRPANADRNNAAPGDTGRNDNHGGTARDTHPDAGRNAARRDASDLQRQIDDLRREVEQLRRRLERPGPGFFPAPPNFPGVPNFPAPDGAGRLPHPRMGIMVAPVSAELADQLNLKKGQGLVVMDVRPDSPAAKAGLKVHDVLVEMDGKPVPDNYREFAQMVGQVKADTPVNLVVIRKGKQETIKGLTLPEAREPRRPAPEERAAPRGQLWHRFLRDAAGQSV